MRLSQMTSAILRQDPSRAKKLADKGPLVITENGQAAYVLMRYDEFVSGWRKPKNLFEALRDPHATCEGNFVIERLPLEDRRS